MTRKSLFDYTPEGRKLALVREKNHHKKSEIEQKERHHQESLAFEAQKQMRQEGHQLELQRRKEEADINLVKIKQEHEEDLKREERRENINLEYIKADTEKDIITHKADIELQTAIKKEHLNLLETRRNMQATTSNALADGYKSMIHELGQQMSNKKSHNQELQKLQKTYKIDKAKLILEQELKEKTMTTEKVLYLTTRILERALDLEQSEIDRGKIQSWIREFENE